MLKAVEAQHGQAVLKMFLQMAAAVQDCHDAGYILEELTLDR